ncbi:SH3 domain-containing protein [Streptomyces nitrosporeus]|nr:SH3 domain-containing protein [Streptomyces nitrosporeus]
MKLLARFRKTKRTAILSTALLGLVIPTNALLTATPAAAVSCSGWGWSNPDAGHGYMTKSGTHLKSGPYSACADLTTTVPVGTHLYYHCYVVNDYGNTWTHVRIDGTSIEGWTSDDNLDDNGATSRC